MTSMNRIVLKYKVGRGLAPAVIINKENTYENQE